MLRLTKRADYGMMAMRYLAEHADEDRTHSARDIADAYDIPLPVLAKTLQSLTRAKLVASHHGAMGGYTLARSAQTINTFDVSCALDGPLVITSCTTAHGSCEMAGHCRVQEPLRRVNDSIKSLLSGISIADLTKPDKDSSDADMRELVNILH